MKTYSRKKGDSPSNVIIHVNELCRLCLAKEEEMVPIYDDEAIPTPLRIMACVNLEVITAGLAATMDAIICFLVVAVVCLRSMPVGSE